ncbi:VTT domain-containing protein [Alteromonas sp. C1M14]|uniref:DedA family protein n=1 Tax=Alteromonas sp. C1M14 TaxID=2841567 RepID=UPI001C0A1040|nr:VTT domain-containing protein [Alteromonas sp. C1M14]MBU2976838.1 VTT domain-containing protein [Alteromonas sp. C1M14]
MEFATSIQRWILEDAHSTWLLFVGIILLSYLLEDLAIVTAAAMSSSDTLSMPLAILAIFLGIASGDLGLYWLGKLARKGRRLRFWLLKNQRSRAIQRRLVHRAFGHLFIIRFIPGLRTIGFSLSGFINVPFWVFTSAVLMATALWTGVVFGALYQLGSISIVQQHAPLFIASGLIIMWLVNRALKMNFKRGAHVATK